MRVLIVEDERNLAAAMKQILGKNNYTVDNVYNGEDGLDYALSNIYDVILLDIMLPKLSGLEVLKQFRQVDRTTPVILLTALGEIEDKIKGLDSGADDYLPKPFDTSELLARIRAVSRRSAKVLDLELKFADIELSANVLRLSSETDSVILTLKECELLEFMMKNSTKILSKERIIEKVWGYDSLAMDNHVEVYISFLRKKLTHIKASVEIKTVRGAGYMLCSKD